MSLSAYHKKRSFSKTPEPKGSVLKSTGPLRFVIQKHEATRLHYDFRLELNGVLKSWAIPKGPTLDPESKHLAIMVEDHPMEYENFEGIIPKGQYGGGTVMVWDKGVYTPLPTSEKEKGISVGKKAEKILTNELEKGDLKFVLLGEKLKGEFALVRTKSEDGNAWLLIKKRDEYASKKDVLTKNRSVLTDRTMKQVAMQAEKKQEVWQSKNRNIDLSKTSINTMPKNISPMLAYAIDEAFNKKNWIFEIKWDGYRTIAYVTNGEVHLRSRNSTSYNEKFSHIATSLKTFPTSVILDGEVVVLDKSGHAQFQWLQDYPKTIKGELVYYVFDILYYDGHDLTKIPLLRRKDILKKVLPNSPTIRYSDHIEENGVTFFRQAQKHDIEGIIGKNSESQYHPGARSQDWLKIKSRNRQEAIIAGFTKPKGGRKYFGALVLGMYKRNKLTYIGHTGGGFNDADLSSLHKKLTLLRQDENPFGQAVETNAPVTWVNPKILCEVSFSEWTKDHIMRHPVFIGLRRDKTPKDVKKETPITRKHFFSDEKSGSKRSPIQNAQSTISNPTKIFFPKDNLTKGDLIEYYKSVSKILIPHLKDRPQSLLRFPNGITGESFFQKNIKELVPDWIKTVRVKSENHDITYMLCQDEESLLYMINLGCIDINPWLSRDRYLDKPDYLVIDLDPESVSFSTVITVAKGVRNILEKLGIESFPKTSGAKGIHIYIPMGAQYTYEQVKHFAELLCIEVQKTLPDVTSLTRSPKKRQGKIYLDYLQNRKGQTLASVYSIRPRPKAPVSTPLMWNELTPTLTPDQFTIKNTLKRLEKYGDLFKPVLGKGISIEKILKKLTQI